ncbi:MAG TPA: hypothetical protein VF765_02070 [Polyangiaceae bacterium]
MQLTQYVSAVLNKGQFSTSFPADIDIPRSFVQYCYSLYASGERQSKELGITLSLGAKDALVISDEITTGLATGINLPYKEGASNFGDLHCHPSSSIGHKKGYAAHSPEDVVSMGPHAQKPLFCRFVCSGTRIYLMVHRSGHSAIVQKDVFTVRDKNSVAAQEYLSRRCPITPEQDQQAYEKMSDSRQLDAYAVYKRSSTPGLGKEMERLSIEGGKEIAQKCNLGFYAGDQGYGISVWAYDYLRIYLQ